VVDPASGTVAVLVEIAAGTDTLRLGSAIEAEILLPEERQGFVVPASALVDDGGVSVVYLQVEGESFLRREVTVLARQGKLVLVEGLALSSRLVTLGGNAIRRATLVASDPGEGHVH
jgi:multidrug efflux pump subunit AcrA (membrane-fusion protein)